MTATRNTSAADRPTVSVVIPAYNASDTIVRALTCVYNQTYQAVSEVIVVDDGSADDTSSIVQDRFPNVTLIRQQNGGRASARNAGAAAASGDYISFLDADDEYLPNKIERQMRCFAEHPGVDIVLCRGQLVEADQGASSCRTQYSGNGSSKQGLIYLTFHDLFQKLTPDIGIGNTGWLIRRALYMQLGGQRCDFVRLQDVEFLIRAAGLGYTVAVTSDILAVYHRSSSRLAMCNSPFARAAVAILREYDPRGDGCQARLLAQDMFDAQFRKQLIASAAILGATAETEDSLKLLGEARGMLGGNLNLMARWLMARYLPKMYCSLSAARS